MCAILTTKQWLKAEKNINLNIKYLSFVYNKLQLLLAASEGASEGAP